MRDQGFKTILMAGDALASREFASITGPAGEGVLITFPPDPRKRPTAAAIVKKFKDKGIDPEGYVLYTYAAFQAWAQAAAKAGTTDPQKVAAAMRGGTWDTVLGPISYDNKGDITSGGWAVYRWDKDGNYDEIAARRGGVERVSRARRSTIVMRRRPGIVADTEFCRVFEGPASAAQRWTLLLQRVPDKMLALTQSSPASGRFRAARSLPARPRR